MLAKLLKSRRRRKLLAATSHPLMQQYLQASLPTKDAFLAEVQYLAVDLEMSGMNADKHHIVSIGYVPIINNQVVIAQAAHHLLQVENVDLHQTAPIHHLRDIDLATGESLEAAMATLLEALAGKILVLHHAPLDFAFLDVACRKLYGVELLAPTIDTMLIERNRNHRHESRRNLSIRLSDCRRRYNLPEYKGHNAVIDAIATAELWLAQQAHITADKPTRLSYFLNTI